jgi:hypothetical protein
MVIVELYKQDKEPSQQITLTLVMRFRVGMVVGLARDELKRKLK